MSAMQAEAFFGVEGDEWPNPNLPPGEIVLDDLGRSLRDEVLAFVRTDHYEPPPLPAIAQEIFSACGSGSASAGELADIAHRDAFIAGRVLQLANSAYFQRGSSASTLRQAIVRIGQNELRNLVLAVVLKGGAFKVRGAQAFALQCWRHSLACALAASLLAAESYWTEPHRGFLAGLLHDAGKAVVLHALSQMAHGPKKDEHALVYAPLLCQALHAEVGGLLAEHWCLDEALQEVMTLHHEPVEATVDEQLCSLIALADAMSAEVGFGVEPAVPNLVTHPIRVFMRISTDRLFEILEQLPQMMVQYDID